MYFRKTATGHEEVRLKPGDRLVLNWHRRTFRAVARLPAPEWLRTANPRDFAMGLFQPRWQRLWMQNGTGTLVKGLPLPQDLLPTCVKDIDPFILLPRQYGLIAVGGEALQWAWDEEVDFMRDLFQQTAYVCRLRPVPVRA